MIRYLVPDVFRGALLDSLSGHALSAAALAASFTTDGDEDAQLTAPTASICSVVKAQQPGGSDSRSRSSPPEFSGPPTIPVKASAFNAPLWEITLTGWNCLVRLSLSHMHMSILVSSTRYQEAGSIHCLQARRRHAQSELMVFFEICELEANGE